MSTYIIMIQLKLITSIIFWDTIISSKPKVKEYKSEIDRLTQELQEMKRKYFEQKRKEALSKEKDLALLVEAGMIHVSQEKQNNEKQQWNRPNRVQYVGGGFAVK